MEDTSKVFQKSLQHFLTRRGDQAALARRAEISPSQLNDILKGRRNGSDDLRRTLAASLGYPGRLYEDFLDLGRAALGLLPEQPAERDPAEQEPAEQVNEADLTAGCYVLVPLDQADLDRRGQIFRLVRKGHCP